LAGLQYSANRSGADDLTRRSVDRRCAATTVIHGERAFGERIIKNGVRPRAGHLHLADRLERLEVEDRRRRVTAIAGESTVELARYRNTVHSVGARNVANDFHGRHIDDHHMRSARDVQSAAGSVGREVVPESFASDWNRLDDVIVRRLRGESWASEQCETDKDRQAANATSVHAMLRRGCI